MIETENTYTVSCDGTVPWSTYWELVLNSNEDNIEDKTTIRLEFERSISLHVLVDNVVIEPTYDLDAQLLNHGDNKFYFETNTIEFLIADKSINGGIHVTAIDSIFLSLTLSVELSDFYEAGINIRVNMFKLLH